MFGGNGSCACYPHLNGRVKKEPVCVCAHVFVCMYVGMCMGEGETRTETNDKANTAEC